MPPEKPGTAGQQTGEPSMERRFFPSRENHAVAKRIGERCGTTVTREEIQGRPGNTGG
jgi:hypothetical protein